MIIPDKKQTTIILSAHPDFQEKDQQPETEDSMDVFKAMAKDLIISIKSGDEESVAHILKAFICEHELSSEDEEE